jgi:translation initiation factor 4G
MLKALPPQLHPQAESEKKIAGMSEDLIVILEGTLQGGAAMSAVAEDAASSSTASQNNRSDNFPGSDSGTQSSIGVNSNFLYSDGSFTPYTPRHSDFTIPTSNQGLETDEVDELSGELPRRSIFGNAVQRRYRTDLRREENKWNEAELMDHDNMHPPMEYSNSDLFHVDADPRQQEAFVSEVTLPDINGNRPDTGALKRFVAYMSSLASTATTARRRSSDLTTPASVQRECSTARPRHKAHETVHAQSLLLGLAFCAVWSANNVMAPNLTEMADFFGLDGAAERDLYLGSYCALATGVFSFPIAAGIGVLADLMSRQKLFCITVAGGGLSALITARAKTYPILFVTRLINGGFMAGSTPVAFSFLGDLFAVEERNAASSGLTAMMGLGIILGQVYAGMIGPTMGWQHAFYVSGAFSLFLALLCLFLVKEPERGGKEKVLQDMIKAGTRYDRKLTWAGFLHTVRHNESNSILLWQGFFSSLPWGVIFVFLNDFLSQERGFSVPAATYLVFMFGLGAAAGGVIGGYLGQLVQRHNRSYLPFFMAATTALGILPFICLLNTHFTRAHGVWGIFLAVSSGLVASLPSVNVRPCLINVNPPETRGASLTAANLLISLGRGLGPSCVTLMGSIWQVDRTFSINVTMIVFWIVSAFQLLLLAKTLPKDQDSMEAELASYAQEAIARQNQPVSIALYSQATYRDDHDDGSAMNESIEVSIEDRMTYFDGTAARQTLHYVKEGVEELKQELKGKLAILNCGEVPESSEDEDSPHVSPQNSLRVSGEDTLVWEKKDQQGANERTPLIV